MPNQSSSLFPFQPLQDNTAGFQTPDALRELSEGTPVLSLPATAHLTAFELCAAVCIWAEYMDLEDVQAETPESIRAGAAATVFWEGLVHIHDKVLYLQTRPLSRQQRLHFDLCAARTAEAFQLTEPLDLIPAAG